MRDHSICLILITRYYFGERTKMVPAESPEDADEIPLASANIFSRLTFGVGFRMDY